MGHDRVQCCAAMMLLSGTWDTQGGLIGWYPNNVQRCRSKGKDRVGYKDVDVCLRGLQ